MVEYSLQVIVLILDSETSLNSFLNVSFRQHIIIMIEATSLVPSLLILLDLFLLLLHLSSELFFNPHLSDVILFLIFLPLPSKFFIQDLILLLDGFPRFYLTVTIPLKCLTFFVGIASLLKCHPIMMLLTLKLQGHSLLFQTLQSVIVSLAHLLLVFPDFLLNLKLVGIVNCILIAV